MQEWFNQKATQKKYLLQQIEALQVYIEYLKKGYNIANKGLTTIKDLKQGHLLKSEVFFCYEYLRVEMGHVFRKTFLPPTLDNANHQFR